MEVPLYLYFVNRHLKLHICIRYTDESEHIGCYELNTQPLSPLKSFDTSGVAGFIFKTSSVSVNYNHCDCVIKSGSKRGRHYPVSNTDNST